MKARNLLWAGALFIAFSCNRNRDPFPPLPDAQTVYPEVPEELEHVWTLSREWAGYMGIVIGLSDQHYYYWFYSDVISGREPQYPLIGKYTLENGLLTLEDNGHRMYATEWVVTTQSGLQCLWAKSDIGDFGRLMIPDPAFDAANPFQNQWGLIVKPQKNGP